MQLLSMFCASCEKRIEPQELAVMVAYVLIQDGQGFAIRATDLFHHRCWNTFNGGADAKANPHDNAPPRST